MNFMEWAHSVAVTHPDLRDAIISPNEDWLDILLPDGRTFRFRPSQLIDPNAPEDERTERLNRLISIGVKNAQAPTHNDISSTENTNPSQRNDGTQARTAATANGHERTGDLRSIFSLSLPQRLGATDDEGNPLMLPIVRRADYFLGSHKAEDGDSIVYIPLTDFVAVGLAEDYAERINPLYFSHFAKRGVDADAENHSLFAQAVENLRGYNLSRGKKGVEVGVTRVAGAQVLTLTSPEDYQSSWFADVEIIQKVRDSILQDNPEALPLFVPASRTNLLIVFADDPYLPSFFSLISRNISAPDTIYPLPHTLADDGWSEWIPLADHPAAGVLEELRHTCRSQAYATQAEFLRRTNGSEKNYGHIKDYEVRQLSNGRSVSVATWTSNDSFGTLPLADFINFVREAENDESGDGNTGRERKQVTIRTRSACEIWSAGLSDAEGVWPARLAVEGFPDDSTFQALREAATTRHF